MEDKNIRQILKAYLLGNAAEQDKSIVDNWYQSFESQGVEAKSEEGITMTEKQVSMSEKQVTMSEEEAVMAEAETNRIKQEIWDRIDPTVINPAAIDPAAGAPATLAPATMDPAGADPAIFAPAILRPFSGIDRKTGTGPRRLRTLTVMKAAAMIIILAGAAGALFLVNKNRLAGHDPLAFTTISTGIGEKKKITTPDGSRLILDAGTTIRISDDFSRDRRIGLVDGEVFFDVKKDDQRPFRIECNGLTTTVLGTSFNISAYRALNNISIGVVSGKVRVSSQSAALTVLEKEQELVFNKNSQDYRIVPLDESLTAWQDGKLVFNDLSFDEMAVIAQKNFGVELTTDDAGIKNTRYTTELSAAMPPAAAVEVLAAIHKLRVRQNGSHFVLYK